MAKTAVPPGWNGVTKGRSADAVIIDVVVFCDCMVLLIVFLTVW